MSESLRDQVEHEGWGISQEKVSPLQLQELCQGLEKALEIRRSVQVRNGIAEMTAGTGHHLVDPDSVFLRWLDPLTRSAAFQVVEDLLGGKAILNSFGAVDNRREYEQYVGKVHRDVRSYTRDVRLMMQILVMLDDFTPEKGATLLLPGSHLSGERPSDDEFSRRAVPALGEAGQTLVFDSRMWHAAGRNTTDSPRRALTLTFTRPFIKPQFDYCRYLGYSTCEQCPENVKRLLGYYARVPSSLDEWYQPPERRFYRSDQG